MWGRIKLLLLPLTSTHAKTYLPEPASLQEGEGAAQQLQRDVTAVEDLQEGNKCFTKDGIEKKLMYVDVQHSPTMKVVEEEKSCQNKEADAKRQLVFDLLMVTNHISDS